MLISPERRIWNLNTPIVPDGVDEASSYLLQKHGIEISGGFGPLAGKIFRIGIMGPLATKEGVDQFFRCFEEALQAAGHKR